MSTAPSQHKACVRTARRAARLPAWLLRGVAAALAVTLLGGQSRPPEPTVAASRPPLAQILPMQQVTQPVPDLIGQELAQARQTLAARRLESRDVALDTRGGRRIVKRQAPGAGTRYTAASRPVVTLYHAADAAATPDTPQPDPAPTRMPDLFDLTCAQAEQRVNRLHMRLAGCEEGSRTGRVQAGRIQRQEPAANTRITPNSMLRAWTEPRGLVVPALVGRSCAQARDDVRAAGLGELQCQAEAGPAGVPAGRIHRQSPVAGTVLAMPRTVQAWEAVALVELPELVGLDEAAALARLRELQLRATPSGPPASQGRRVVRQSPAPRTRMRVADEVRLVFDLGMPALTGLDCAAARSRAAAHGLPQLDCVSQRAGPAQPLRRVFDQTPAAGTRLAQAVAAQVRVAEPVRVPQLVGQRVAQALDALRREALQGEADGTDGDREVTRQQPAAGAEVAPGSTVRLVTQAFGQVPAVVGLPLAQARARVVDAGYRAQPDATDREADRSIITQQPAAGTRLARGQPVRLATQLAVAVPDVLRLRLPEAQAHVAAAGLTAQHQARGPSGGAADDAVHEVRAQQPAAGQRVAAGSAVRLSTVRLVQVPALVDATCEAAAQRLRGAGLAPGACVVESALPLVLGSPRVTQQQPAAGQWVDEASAVALRAVPPAWSAPALVGSGLLTAGGLGLMMMRRRAGAAGRPAVEATLAWRVRPDPSPAVTLRLAAAAVETGADEGDLAGTATDTTANTPAESLREGRTRARDTEPWPRLRWRVERHPPLVGTQGLGLITGEPDDKHG